MTMLSMTESARRHTSERRECKRVVVVAPQFPPCNLAAVHRSRLFVQHLPAFGFEPIVLTVRPDCYEEPLDPELTELVPSGLRVVQTGALPVRPVRFVGDLGLRSFWPHYRAICRLAAAGEVDLLFLPIPPYYSSLLGPLVKRRFGIPYVIDYIDPWIYPMTAQDASSWKARASHWLARRLEPLAVRSADGLTGVAEGYFAGVLERHPHLRSVPQAGIPYGGEASDHAFIARTRRPSRLLERLALDNRIVLAYAGALLPRAMPTLQALFRALRVLRAREDNAHRLHLLFVGTGTRPSDPTSGTVEPVARAMGLTECVTEVAERQPYLEVLALLHRVQAVLVLGSTERHYTASKIFQAMHSRRPILALLHEASTSAGMLQGVPGVQCVTFGDEGPTETHLQNTLEALGKLLGDGSHGAVERDLAMLEQYSARVMAGRLATCFRAVLERAALARMPGSGAS